MVLAAGNLRGDIAARDYPDRNDLEEVESPAQAWDPLVAGAYTDKIAITHPDFSAGNHWRPRAICRRQVAPPASGNGNGRSGRTLYSRAGTSPVTASIRPRRSTISSLSQHTTVRRCASFETFGDTSAAAALGSNLAAGILAARPRDHERFLVQSPGDGGINVCASVLGPYNFRHTSAGPRRSLLEWLREFWRPRQPQSQAPEPDVVPFPAAATASRATREADRMNTRAA